MDFFATSTKFVRKLGRFWIPSKSLNHPYSSLVHMAVPACGPPLANLGCATWRVSNQKLIATQRKNGKICRFLVNLPLKHKCWGPSWAAAFSRCGNVFFPLRQLFGLQSWTFSAAGFFPASAGFFLASDGVFPASDGFFPLPLKCIFSAAKVLLCCCKVFFLLLWIFPAAKRHFLLAFFPLRK